MATYTEAGKGRKQCKNCNIFVGVRCHECPKCQHDFTISTKVSPKEVVVEKDEDCVFTVTQDVTDALHLRIIHTPGGTMKKPMSPAHPDGDYPHTDMEVTCWVEQVIQKGVLRGELFSIPAILYLAKNKYWVPNYKNDPENHMERVEPIIKSVAPAIIARYSGKTST